MAALNPSGQTFIAFDDGKTDRFIVLGIRGISTLDTLDVSGWFSKVVTAAFIATTVNAQGLCTVTGTTVTIVPTGLTGDAGYLMVRGTAV